MCSGREWKGWGGLTVAKECFEAKFREQFVVKWRLNRRSLAFQGIFEVDFDTWNLGEKRDEVGEEEEEVFEEITISKLHQFLKYLIFTTSRGAITNLDITPARAPDAAFCQALTLTLF